MRIDKENGRVYARQSFLNDVMICPERARYKMLYPDVSGPSDATIMGTAVHSGIEHFLRGDGPASDIAEVALSEHARLKSQPHTVTNLDPDKAETQIQSMTTAFVDGIMPIVELGGYVEHKFQYPTGMFIGDWEVWAEGTMDYLTPSGVVWDWKTSSRPYNARDKQATSIQATVYGGAVVYAGLADWPVDFRYGVMVRNLTPKPQIVNLMRNEAHMNWLRKTLEPVVRMTLQGLDNPWPMNDTSALCSSKWCPFWSMCKGAFCSDSDLWPLVDTVVPSPVESPTTNSNKEVANNDNQ
jgi:hypothetical protein